VLRAIECATATPALVGRTVTGKTFAQLKRLADNPAVLSMIQTIAKESTVQTHELPLKVLPFCRNPGFQRVGAIFFRWQ
jgi:hypothetical protein